MRLAEAVTALIEIAAGVLQLCPGLILVHKEGRNRYHEGDVPIVVRIGRPLIVTAAVMLLAAFLIVMAAVMFLSAFLIVMAAVMFLSAFLIVMMTAVVFLSAFLIVMMTAVMFLAALLIVMMAAVMTVLPCDYLVERLITY